MAPPSRRQSQDSLLPVKQPQHQHQQPAAADLESNNGPYQTFPALPKHCESHVETGGFTKDVILGFADGMCVPFALTASLSATNSTRVVIMGGLAELFAGMISMGVGNYLAAVTEAKQYDNEEAREYREVDEKPEAEEEEIYEIFDQYNIGRDKMKPFVDALMEDKDMWVKFMMDFELRMEKPDPRHALWSALVIGIAYFIGGGITLMPYFFYNDVLHGLIASICVAAVENLAFGYIKAWYTGCSIKASLYSAVQTLVLGAVAAATAYGFANYAERWTPHDEDAKRD